jgi:hypothetical protein
MKKTRFSGARVRFCRLAVMLTLVGIPAASGRTAEASAVAARSSSTAMSAFDPASWQDAAVGHINAKVFAMALKSAANAIERGDVSDPGTLTVIDYSKPSTERRMWVYDLRSRTLLFEELVSHGRGSGTTLATSFSNAPESNRSSLGLYRTAETYTGKHGYSLRIDGLEKGFNDHARERAIVMHAADYVNEKAAKAQGYLGRSLGCPAVRPEVAHQVIDAVKGGGLIFAYYPDPEWLRTSKYLT